MAQFFIHRPIFAWVISIIIMLAGGFSILTLPLEQYPDIAPPRITVSANYTGASAQTVENSVTQIIEQQIKGLDGMLYMQSTANAAGSSRTTITFSPGTDIDAAQVQVQNKLQSALNRLPDAVRSRGVSVSKGGQDYLVIYSFYSTNPKVTQVDIGDYLNTNLVDLIGRVEGVGDVSVFGTSYAMRIWLQPDKMRQFSIVPSDIISALNAQNTQVSAGQLGALPAVEGQQLNATIVARSKLKTVEEFENVILKTATDGSIVRLADVARVELGADNLNITSRLNGMAGAGLAIVLADGANAMAVSQAVTAALEAQRPHFPDSIDYFISSDSTPFVRASISEVVSALAEAMVLVIIVMLVFLQSWRATLIAAITVPVVLLGTFGVLAAAGYSINTLTMFAMVLAIGLLVDDAIVVVENVERVMAQTGSDALAATQASMREITPALIGIGVTLSAVFVPMAFFGGSTGVIYRQFSITIVAAMALSVFVALTLTPALCASLLKAHASAQPSPKSPNEVSGVCSTPTGWLQRLGARFNRAFDRAAGAYASAVQVTLGRTGRMLVAFVCVAAAIGWLSQRLPAAFLPEEDQGYFMVNVTLPAGATNARLQVVLDDIREYLLEQPEVVSFNQVSGLSGGQNSAMGFVRLRDWADRPDAAQSAKAVVQRASAALGAKVRDARVIVILPSAVRGLGSGAGFNLMLKDVGGIGHEALLAAKDEFLAKARADARLANVRSSNLDDSSELRLDIDERRAAALGVSAADINSLISGALGGVYVNDFIHNGRVKRVYIQADAPHRMQPQDIGQWAVRNKTGEMVPLSAFTTVRWDWGSPQLMRFNGASAYEIDGAAAAGLSSGQAMAAVEDIMRTMPEGVSYEWTGAALQERQSGAQAPVLYAVSILFVFLCLAALYESWTVPLAVMLAVPLGVLGALAASYGRGLSNDVYFQVGLLTTVGLAAKNAILIVEFAVQLQQRGMELAAATMQAARLRLRPIIMTSLAFGFGVIPLALGTGAGSGARRAIGTAVLGGTLASTFLGLLFVPVFFLLVRRWLGTRPSKNHAKPASTAAPTP